MKKVKNILYLAALPITFNIGNAFSYNFGLDKANPNLFGDSNTADVTIQSWLVYLFGFLALAAIIYGLYGGFLILTARDDDDIVKKGKTVIIQSLIGLAIIFLAGPIVNFFIGEGGIFTTTPTP